MIFYGVIDIGLFFAVTAEQLGQVGEVQGSPDAATSDAQQLAQQSHLQSAAVSIYDVLKYASTICHITIRDNIYKWELQEDGTGLQPCCCLTI